MNSQVIIAPTFHTWVDNAVEIIIQAAETAIRKRGRFSLVLSGGGTPRPVYQALAEPVKAAGIDWSRTHIFWGDERAVPSEHPDSNYRMAKQALLDHVPLPADNIHRILGELPPTQAAAAYRHEIETFFAEPGSRFDLVLLGLGTDGHTASLFPESEALEENRLMVVPNYVSSQDAWRITLTYPALASSRQIAFLVGGEAKAAVVQQIMQDPEAKDKFPAAQVAAEHPDITWVLDQGAAKFL